MQQPDYLKNLNRYTKALEETRINYLELFKSDKTTKKEENEIWDASFVLQYMIATNKEYINRLSRLKDLNSSNLNKDMQVLLNEINSKIDRTSFQDIHSFIANGQQSLIGNEIGTFFGTLADINQKKSNFFGVATPTFFLISGLAVTGLVTSIAFVPPALVVTLFILAFVTLLGSLAVVKMGSSVASHYGALAADQKSINNSKLGDEFFCRDSYQYIKDKSNGVKIHARIEPPGKTKQVSDLRCKFTQPFKSSNPLADNSIFNRTIQENVKEKYDYLVREDASSPMYQG